MTDKQDGNHQTTKTECGRLLVPEMTAKEADRRAKEIFDREAAFSKPFNECLGMIYMVGVAAGIEAARHHVEIITDG